MYCIRCDRTAAWKALTQAFDNYANRFDLRRAFSDDPMRWERLSQTAPHVFADLSKNLLDAPTESLLMQLARECGLEARRDAMLTGEQVNASEQRAAMHWLLRYPAAFNADRPEFAIKNVADSLREVHATLDAMLAFAEAVRGDVGITDIVNIGIGGSDLGPQMAVLALAGYAVQGKRFHFVSNVDGHELKATLEQLHPERTMFLVASKTFTTLETMTNARSAKAWFEAQGGRDVARHFVALTTNVAAAGAFGIHTTFGFWDWVGGRYSVWSAIGLPLAIAIGAQAFRAFLAGAHDMDEHFRRAPLESNLPVRLGLLDVWYRNFHGFTSRCIAPYHSALKRWPAFLQQLEMESNGKRVAANGEDLPYDTAPVLWGEPGTNGQHAFFQALHQGTNIVPVEFVAVRQARHDLAEHQRLLLANAVAQAQALMCGRPGVDSHRHFAGNRPSTFLLLDVLSPESLGALIALQEHRVFVSGAIWGINSFDQWGVELGKVLAQDLAARLLSGDHGGLDASTAGLLGRLSGLN